MKNDNIPQITSSLNFWLSYLEKIHNKTIDMSLERIIEVAVRLNVLNPAPFVFTVTGTNGKSTTCRMLETVLIAAGYRVGVYSSPHLIHYSERLRIQNVELPEAMHIASFSKIENMRGNISLTYFEYSTLSALWLFKKAKLDIVILEVGLGGRLDATNIIDADVAVVTNIALDHTDWLGSDRESIGLEKAGIFRSGKPAIIGDPDIPETIEKVAWEKGTKLFLRDINWNFTILENTWIYSDEQGDLVDLPLPQIPQPNAATALAALRASHLKINKQAVCTGIQNATLLGRFQIVRESPYLILDVAHNPHAATYLIERLKSIQKNGHVSAVIGMLCDKDIEGTLACMRDEIDSWYFAPLENKRSASTERFMKYLNKGEVYDSVTCAWHAAMTNAKKEDTVLVCGSFHTVACVMQEISLSGIGRDS